MYFFTIGAIFKNESHILQEWINHYFLHGVDHIYLIDDNSTDNPIKILKPYINSNKITLYNAPNQSKYVGIQEQLYNTFFQQHLKDTLWFGILDLDEFLYSPLTKNIPDILKLYFNKQQLEINWVHFGSSNYIKQPKSVVHNFINRAEYNNSNIGPNGRYNSHKCIIKTYNRGTLNKIILGIHNHIVNGTKSSYNISFKYSKPQLLINHYAIQSKEYWEKIKMTRGDVNYWYNKQNWKRNIELFNQLDINTIEDRRLSDQNS